MKARIAKLWVDALRSGEFKQGSGQLKVIDSAYNNREKYCCLGVLCELHSRDMKRMKKKAPKWEGDGDEYLGSTGTLPEEVVKWAGMEEESEGDTILSKSYKVGAGKNKAKEYKILSSLNDDGATFKRIASIIEKEIERL